MAPLKLPQRLRAVFPLYFEQQPPMRQEDIARMFGVTQSAISHRIRKIYRIHEENGIQLPRPSYATLRTVTARSASVGWDSANHEYTTART